MKKLILFAGWMLFGTTAIAQEPTLDYSMVEGFSSSNDYTYGIGRKDAFSQILTVGRVYNSVNSSNDVVINIYQGQSPIYTITFGSSGSDYASAMEMSPTANFAYFVGQFEGSMTVPMQGGGSTTLTSSGSSDVFIGRFSLTLGNEGISWIKKVGGSGADVASDVAIDPSGNAIITGQFTQTADFDPGAGTVNKSAAGLNDIFVLKLDISGNYTWVETIGSLANDYAGGIDADNAGNLALVGRFGDNIDLNPGGGTANHSNVGASEDIFITKWNSNGSYLWSHSVGSSLTDYLNDVDFDNNGDIVAVGYFGGSFDIDPGPNTETVSASSAQNGLLWKLDGSGAHQWAHVYASVSSNQLTVVETNAQNDIYVAGTLNGTVDVDPGAGTSNETGTDDGFLLYLKDDGYFFNITQYGNTSDVFTIRDIALSGSEYISMAGSFTGTADVNPGASVTNLFSNGGTDGFLVNLYNCQPTFITPDSTNLSALSGECSVSLTATVPTATNQCGESIQGVPDMTSPITTIGTHTVTWTFDDLKGNVATQTQSVTVTDGSAPTPDVANLSGITGECSVAMPTAPTASDNCSGTINGVPDVTFPITAMGTTVVTWTYTDGAGNTATQTQNVTITDTTAPVPSLGQLMQLTGECEVQMPNAPFANDNCAGVIYGTPDVSFPITAQGTTTVTWTYDDGQGNTASQVQYVIINDTTAPVPDVAQLPDLTGVCEVTGTVVSATDNCQGTIGGQTSVPFPITTIGTTVITWTFDDGNGNVSTQTQNVIISGPDTSTIISGGTITANLSGGQYQWIDCDNGNQAISGATGQSFTPTTAGSYAVIVSNGTCEDTSSCILMAEAGVEAALLPALVVYPNPSEDVFTISGLQLGQSYSIWSATGQELMVGTASSEDIIIDLKGLSNAVYIMRMEDGRVVRLIKK